MTKRIMILALLSFVCVAQASEASMRATLIDETFVKQDNNKVQPAFVRLWLHYITSLVLSGAIGATTGGLTRYVEKRFNPGLFLGIFVWLLESKIRHESITVLQNDLDIYDIGHKKILMFDFAWIASWLVYLNV